MCGTEAPPGGGHQAVQQGACAGLLSVRASRKALFTALSLALFALHLGLLLSDALLHAWRQTEEGSSHHFTEALLVSHVMSFYWALLGAVYSVESGSDRMSVISLTSADSSSTARRSSGRRSVPPRNSSETLAPTPGVKRSIVVKKIVARKTQVTGSSPAVRRSPRVSPSNKENTKRASGSELCQPAQPAPPSAKVRLLSPVLPASSSPARGHANRASGAKARVRSSAQSPPPPPLPPRPATPLSPILPPNPAAPPSSSSSPAQSHAKRATGAKTRVRGSPLSPILPPRPAAPPSPQNGPPAQPDPDPGDLLWSQKVRRSYSRLSDSGAASPPPSSSSSSSSSSPAPRRCSLFGFRRLLTPERPPAETTWVSAGSATLLDATSAPEPGQPDPHIPGVALVKERKRKKKVPQIKMSELDHLAAQLNAEFEEAEKFDLVFE
ncbi:sororin isoform X3 [Lepisosteus oculatus]